MMENTHVSDLLAGYTLRCLEADETMQVVTHLAGCSQCRDESEAFQTLVDQLALAVPDVQPSPELKERILRKVQSEAPPKKENVKSESWRRQLAVSFRPFVPAWNLAAATAILLLTFSSVIFWQRGNNLEQRYLEQDFQHVVLKCTHVVPEASGQVIVSKDGEVGMLAVAHLPVLDTEQSYQVWLIQDGQRNNGGTFTVNQQGYGMLTISTPESLLDCEISITVEPREGSIKPSGETVLQTMI